MNIYAGFYLVTSPVVRSLLLLLFVLLMIGFLYEVAFLVHLRAGLRCYLLLAVVFIVEFGIYQRINILHTEPSAAGLFPLIPAVAADLLFALTELLLIWHIHNLRTFTITPMSVREAVDHLPAGICLYHPNGLCRLVNVRMEESCRALTGGPLRNGSVFWDWLSEHHLEGALPDNAGDTRMVRLENGRVLNFRRSSLTFPDGIMYELHAYDVTEEYYLNQELKTKKKQVDNINYRLRMLNEQIADLTRDQEILNSKIRVHDTWSRALLLTRRHILNPTDAGQEEAIRNLQKALILMESAYRPAERDPEAAEELLHAAGALGIRIEYRGSFFETHTTDLPLLQQACTVCVSNLAQHTHGRTLYVEGREENGMDCFYLTNDGEPPAGDITESGGLLNLRRLVERAGGSMRISSRPQFVLEICLPGNEIQSEGEGKDGLSGIDRR